MKKNYYEVTYIVNPVLEEAQIKEEVAKFSKFVTDNGGEFDEVNEWGIRRLSYEMDGKGSGYFVNMYFTSPSDLIAKMERAMQISDNIIRYMTLKYDNKMLRHRELQKKGAVPNIFKTEETETEA
ncbi:30S ribosomal protein S6 [bacterium]|nr:MAG: 30S ribosomal protein S6 [bacterium]